MSQSVVAFGLRRTARGAVVGLSTLSAVIILFAWARSHLAQDAFTWTLLDSANLESGSRAIVLDRGQVRIHVEWTLAPTREVYNSDARTFPPRFQHQRLAEYPGVDAYDLPPPICGFLFSHSSTPIVRYEEGGADEGWRAWHLFFPFWVAFLAAVSPLAWLALRVQRGRHRLKLNRCQRCGYDLRATPDRCPECGAVTRVSPNFT